MVRSSRCEDLSQKLLVERMSTITTKSRPSPPTQTVERALSLLDALGDSPEPLTLTELSQRVAMHASTCLRLLRTLEAGAYVAKIPETGQYRLGARIFSLARALEAQIDIRAIARPVLQHLSTAIGESAGLVIRQGNEGIVIERVVGPSALRHVSGVGDRGPLYCTSAGKALLAWEDPAWVDLYLASEPLAPRTETTITAIPALRHELDHICQLGYAVDQGEREVGLHGASAPVRDATGHVVAVLGFSGPAERINTEALPDFIKQMLLGAAAVSAQLGWTAAAGLDPDEVPGRPELAVANR